MSHLFLSHLTLASAFDLPVLRQWAKEAFPEGAYKDPPLDRKEPVSRVSRRISFLIAHILALSLLDTDLNTIRLHFSKDWVEKDHSNSRLWSYVYDALRLHRCGQYSLSAVVDYVLDMLGHINASSHEDVPDRMSARGRTRAYTDTSDWLGSSRRGQVVLPSLLLDMTLENEPCYRFISVPGVLSVQARQGETFEVVISTESTYDVCTEDPNIVPSAQVKSLTRFASFEHEWFCRFLPGSLQVHLGLKDHAQVDTRSNLRNVLEACRHLIFIPACGHATDHVKPEQTEDYIFMHPHDFFKAFDYHETRIQVYAVRGNSALRLMIIGVIHRQLLDESYLIGFSRYACLQCSLEICRKEGARFLVC